MYPPQGTGGTTDTVDGFHASATPIALQLLPLDASKVLPLDTPIPLAGIPTPLTGKSADKVDGLDLPNTIANIISDYAYQSGTMKIGSVRFAWGTAAAGSPRSVTFPVAFGGTPEVSVNYIGTKIITGQTITVTSRSSTGMTIESTDTTHDYTWIAVGTI